VISPLAFAALVWGALALVVLGAGYVLATLRGGVR